MAEVHAHHGMRPLGELLPHDEALRRILDACSPVAEREDIPLAEASGRVLAGALESPADVPAFARAAMDGFAVRSSDAAAAGARLRVAGVVHAGEDPAVAVRTGEAVQVATGAPLPEGADAVVPVERTRDEGDTIVLEHPVRSGEHVSRAGSDLRRGQVALPDGALLTPARIAVAAAVGRGRVTVWRRPRVLVASTGSELRPPGTVLRRGEIHDSNGIALATLFRARGADVDLRPSAPDDASALRALLRGATADLVVLSGGSSAGERDLVRDAVSAEGRIEFHGVRVKPGKPLLLGRVGRAVVVGLPGYPASCLSDAYLFVLPALDRLAHRPLDAVRIVPARLAERVRSVPDRLWFVPVRLENGRAVPTFKESGATTSLADAQGYVEIPPNVPFVDQGDLVQVVLF